MAVPSLLRKIFQRLRRRQIRYRKVMVDPSIKHFHVKKWICLMKLYCNEMQQYLLYLYEIHYYYYWCCYFNCEIAATLKHCHYQPQVTEKGCESGVHFHCMLLLKIKIQHFGQHTAVVTPSTTKQKQQRKTYMH